MLLSVPSITDISYRFTLIDLLTVEVLRTFNLASISDLDAGAAMLSCIFSNLMDLEAVGVTSSILGSSPPQAVKKMAESTKRATELNLAKRAEFM